MEVPPPQGPNSPGPGHRPTQTSKTPPRVGGPGMHRARFVDPDGRTRQGVLEDGVLRDGDATFPPDEVAWLPPCEPTKIVCVGANYREHIEEMGRQVPERPLLFLKGPNAVVGHGEAIELLPGVDRTDQEAELGVVVGERCRNVDAGDTLDVVAGYTCVDDVSNRDDQMREVNWVRGKAFDTSCPLGPVLATPDEVPDDARIRARVGGKTRQDARIDDMVFGVPELVAEVSRYLTLMPGDVIATGTPSGVGPLSPGDRVEIEIEGIGTLANPVRGPS